MIEMKRMNLQGNQGLKIKSNKYLDDNDNNFDDNDDNLDDNDDKFDDNNDLDSDKNYFFFLVRTLMVKYKK